MDVVEKIGKVKTGRNDKPVDPVIINTITLEPITDDAKMANKEAKSEERHYVYLVRCSDDSLYCGWTTDLERRIDAHNGHIPGGAKYTRGRRPVTLVYAESFHHKHEAQRREYAIKQMTKTKKLRLIKGAK